MITVFAVSGGMSQGIDDAIDKTAMALPVEHVRKHLIVPGMDRESYSKWIFSELAGPIKTKFALIVQADGFARHPDKWTDEFLLYDYIGAPWDNGVVGNGGFSLRSKRLIEACAGLKYPGQPEDYAVCLVHRARLEEMGMRFAPLELALRFSFENKVDGHPWNPDDSFGFHGKHLL